MSFRFSRFEDSAARIQPVNAGSDVALTTAEGVRQSDHPVGLMKYLPPALIVISAVLSVIWTAALFWFAYTLIIA